MPICLRNLSACSIEVPTKAVTGKVTAGNQVLPVVLPMETLGGSTCSPQIGWILEELNLYGLGEGPEAEQEKARELLLKWEHMFANSDLDLDKTSFIKHQIELADQMPFKVCYWCILSHMYDDVEPISRRCWIMVPSGSHTVHGLVQ